jgi:hypothetical protein
MKWRVKLAQPPSSKATLARWDLTTDFPRRKIRRVDVGVGGVGIERVGQRSGVMLISQ